MNEDELLPGSACDPHTFVLFGATGDLAHRKLYPALFRLYEQGLLSDDFTVVGVARRALDDVTFRDLIRSAVHLYGREPAPEEASWNDFIAHFHYCRADATRADEFPAIEHLVTAAEQGQSGPVNRLFYLAMAPEFFSAVAINLKASGLTRTTGWKRLIIEKPFGRDLETATRLNEALRQVFAEEEIYRIDHYLGKEMVQNIEVIRFANSIFEPVWNNHSIASVQITSSETVGVEERAPYYDQSGALRDMVQNHMLQMVMMVAMEPPSRLKTEAIRDEKVKVLRSMRRYGVEEVARHVVRGQYSTGQLQGQPVPAYADETGVQAGSRTETFLAARLYVDNFRWAGVPFYLRTGKRMAVKSTEIVIQFRELPKHLYFNQDGLLGPNLLVIRINPVEGMYMQLNAKRPGTEGGVLPIAMDFSQTSDQSPRAYERLVYDAVRGDSTYFTRWDEVSLAWKLVDPIEAAFRSEDAPLHLYAAGSWGPTSATELLAEDGMMWWPVHGEALHDVADARSERAFAQAVGARARGDERA